MTTTTASPAKLKNGSWGARVPGRASEGDTITIKTRAGKRWDATISRVLWTGADRRSGETVSLVATESRSSGSARSNRRQTTWTGCSCGSVEEYERDGDCDSCRYDR